MSEPLSDEVIALSKRDPLWEGVKGFVREMLFNVALFGGINVMLNKMGRTWREALHEHVNSAWGLKSDALFGVVFGVTGFFSAYSATKEAKAMVDKKSHETDAQMNEIHRLLGHTPSRGHAHALVSSASHQGQVDTAPDIGRSNS